MSPDKAEQYMTGQFNPRPLLSSPLLGISRFLVHALIQKKSVHQYVCLCGR